MKLFFIFLACTISGGCYNNKKDKTKLLTGPQVNDTAQLLLPIKISYTNYLQKIKTEKTKLRAKSVDGIRAMLYECISKDMPAYWIGTTWDFNGTTRTPKQGAIACGYFVTTVLQDIGFTINRTKLAQQVSSVMIKLLAKNIASFSNILNMKNYLQNQPAHSVFIVGLDFHTGFIIKDEKESYFFHSNYINRQGVIMEKLENSLALKSSKSFMIGSLSANDGLLRKWTGN